MSKTRVLFVDRDGTLIEEPPDEQVDAIEKIRFMPGVFAALRQAQKAGFKLAMVTNQDGLGSESFPQAAFDVPHQFMMDSFSSQDVEFDAVFVCPHRKADGCDCRKPKTRLVDDWVREREVDLAGSAMIGDRETDMEFARNLGVRGLLVRRHGNKWETWQSILRELTERRATIRRTTKETDIHVTVNLDNTGPITISTGIGFFDHMLEQLAKHGGFSLELKCHGDLEIDEHHTVEDCALAVGEALRESLGAKLGLARYGFMLPMDEAQVRVAIDLSGRSYGVFEGKFAREAVGGLPTELVPHFFKSLAESLKAAIHVTIVGENTHHMIEACFKGVGRALRMALRREGEELPTTKGVL
ncbi:MAG TPA: bifunctional histidinol-phosphatase/imidazoleglycerol-phosphate dehydratase HisB [Steroidobacteraceae bacterium]|nr:bifunctional histidinol-phosphatase/imidazoleglycerol-phosphate dehydratase HisB [Steroidobacteraceae bacterium]